ncbi:hypothetical protein [Shimazuella alba]|uniref:Uncharacterized protein n=1 Tax=Shimazuella alba TaxID=2690964 RepID=A0A6I4W3G8_9BACL|nr:hypothetical protein [Shimazuella alba]MXQ55324.1 hypothetical protein [Shimazuella alba]
MSASVAALAKSIKDLPRIFQVGGKQELEKMKLVQEHLENMLGRKIRIHPCQDSVDADNLHALLEGSIREIRASSILIADAAHQKHSARFAKLLESDSRFRWVRIYHPKGSSRFTIGVAIERLAEVCQQKNPSANEMKVALQNFQRNLAELIKTTLVFVL